MIEPIAPIKVVKDIAPNALTRGGERLFLPGFMVDCENARYKNNGARGVSENVPGTLLINLTLPAGDNKCIGRFFNSKSNKLIVFIWNSNNDDRIIEYDVDTTVSVNLLAGDLGFEKDNYITQGGVVDDQLIWNDRVKPARQINITMAKAGVYTAPYNDYELSLAARPPHQAATFTLGLDAAVSVNSIIGKSFQFAYQFVYKDNRVSTFSPLSALAWVGVYGKPDNVNNTWTVRVFFPAELAGIVKRIDVIYREGNVGNYFIFEQIKNPVNSQYDVKFTNSGKSIPVSTVDQNRLSDAISDQMNGLEVVDNRIFTTLNKMGFNVDDTTFNFTVQLVQEVAATPYNTTNRRYLKKGGEYIVGVILEGDYGRTSFVKKAVKISVPHTNIGNPAVSYYLRWTLTGTPPPGMKRYRVVISENRFQTGYMVVKAIPHFYEREATAEEIENNDNEVIPGDNGNPARLYCYSGKAFLLTENASDLTDIPDLSARYMYLQVPDNVPFIPDSTYMVRLPDGLPQKYVQILGVTGKFLICPFIPYANWGTYLHEHSQHFSAPESAFYIEIFKKAEGVSDTFYEFPKFYNIVNDDWETFTDDMLYGDTYNLEVNSANAMDPGYDYGAILVNSPIVQIDMINRFSGSHSLVESPTGTMAGIVQKQTNAVTSSQGGDTSDVTAGSTAVVFSLDYNKIANDFGRAHTVNDDEKEQNLFSTVGFSNPYIQNSQINGLNTFLALNTYALGVERGPITMLIRSEKTLLAIHEQTTSSLYIGDGFVRTGKEFIMTKTDDVVGDDRQLEYGYGTINPESALRVFDYVFWWDAYKGAVVQYSQAGLHNVAGQDMRAYFYKKSRDYFPYRHQVKILTGFDHSTDELIISFPEVRNEANTVIIAAETWAYNLVDKDWSTKYSFFVENYATVGQRLYSFKAGQLWQHNHPNATYNNFHGVQYTRKMRFAINPYLHKNKRYFNVHIKGSLCLTPVGDFLPVRFFTSGQESYTPAYEFELDEGIWVGPILKNINTPGAFAGQLPLRSGDDMVGNLMEVLVENNALDKGQTEYLNVVYVVEEFSA